MQVSLRSCYWSAWKKNFIYQGASKGCNISASIMVAVALVWLCCKPTKIKHPTSSSDSMN